VSFGFIQLDKVKFETKVALSFDANAKAIGILCEKYQY